MKRLIELIVFPQDYEEFVKYYDEDFEWETDEELEDEVYDLLNYSNIEDLEGCPFVQYSDY